MNTLLKPFVTEFDTIPFSKIKDEDFKEAFEVLLEQSKNCLDAIKNDKSEATFENTLVMLENGLRGLSRVYASFSNLWTADTNDTRNEILLAYEGKIKSFFSSISMDEMLFKRVDKIFKEMSSANYTPEQITVITNSHRGFVNNGVSLCDADKEKVKNIDEKLSALTINFAENVRKNVSDYVLNLKSEDDLRGAPDWYKESAKQEANDRGLEGYVITLNIPSYLPFMQYCEHRHYRKQLYMAAASKGLGEQYDNRKNIQEIVELRLQRANVLGFATHAEYVLTERMASKTETVTKFLNELVEATKDYAKKDIEKISSFAKSLGCPSSLERWDFAFYSEKYKEKNLGISDEILRPYLKLETVLNAIFELSHKLYGISFKEIKTIDLYNDAVSTYEVFDTNGTHLGIIYFDFFPRKSKKGGAWMTQYKDQYFEGGVDSRPHVSIVCNFTPPANDRPSLLTFNEVVTLFHEFGHGLHGLLSKCHYTACSGTTVLWDFVELPSQIMENWAFCPEVLKMFARHYETGVNMPEEYVVKLQEEKKFMAGYSFIRQLEFATLDMAWHTLKTPVKDLDPVMFEKKILEKLDLFPKIEGTCTSTAFSHIFSGGYSAGYYSYKWAELLEADAFAEFEKHGVLNQKVAMSFRKNILEKGGSEHPAVLFKKFKGRDPELAPLLRKFGFK